MNLSKISFMIPGTLAANHTFIFTADRDCTLLHVSAVNTSANAGTIKIGDSSDDDEYLTASNFGVSSTPTEFDGNDFVDTSGNTHTKYYPRISDGTVVVVTVTDHGSHMANVSVILTLADG